MDVVKKINKASWITDEVTQLFLLLNQGDDKTLFVGGCVRNELMGFEVVDIDMATSIKPEDLRKILTQHRVKNIPTGIEHGTITAVLSNQTIEITTLRKDVETDGRHAVTEWTDNWVEDARRRDFTLNTLLMNDEGHVFDPLGSGLKALEEQHIEFVGEPAKRIEEDYLRILRYFRFQAIYGNGKYDEDALEACAKASESIKSLSRERITQEFFKILSSKTCAETLSIMFKNGVLADMNKSSFNPDALNKLVELQDKYPHSSGNDNTLILARLFCIQGNKPIFYDDYLRFSRAQQNFYVRLELAFNTVFYSDEKQIKKAIFNHGKALLLQGYLLLVASDVIDQNNSILDIFKNWEVLECPVTGDSLLAEGYKTGPELGQELERRRDEWMDENF